MCTNQENTPAAGDKDDNFDQDGDGDEDCDDEDCEGIACDPTDLSRVCQDGGGCEAN